MTFWFAVYKNHGSTRAGGIAKDLGSLQQIHLVNVGDLDARFYSYLW
jgi:hypothetical protein